MPATHGTPHPYIYIFEKNGKSLFYFNDSGYLTEETMSFVKKELINMQVKFVFENPVIVAYGPEHKGLGWSEWGYTQFPDLYRGDNGELICLYSDLKYRDTTDGWGKLSSCSVSMDNGATWRCVLKETEEYKKFLAQTGIRTSTGGHLRSGIPAIEEISDELYKELKNKRTPGFHSLPAEKLPKELKITGMPCYRSEKGGANEEYFLADWDFPAQCVGFPPTEIHPKLKKGVIKIFVYANSAFKKDKDGKIWFATNMDSRNPSTMAESKFDNIYVFCSEDDGNSFYLKSYIMSEGKHKGIGTDIGFYEPELCFMPDESIIMLIRTGSASPSLITRSKDGGNTWSEPKIFDKCGIRPRMVHLKNGVTLALYGRPGQFLRATADSSGQVWDKPCELMPYEYDPTNPEKLFTKSCFNSSIIEIDENTAMIAYSDFFTEDENGITRKAIKVCKVHTKIV